MSFLVTELFARVSAYAGWVNLASWPTTITPLQVYNEAGEWLYSSRQWSFLAQQFDEVDINPGQDFILLPPGFAGLLGVYGGRTNPACGLRISSWQAVMEQRAYPAQSGGGFVGCISHLEPDAQNPEPIPVIAIGPTPSAGVQAAFQIAYTGKWPRVTANTTKLHIPDWMVPLYIRTCCHWIGGYHKELKGTLEDRLAVLKRSDLYMAAWDRDDNLQPDQGGSSGSAESFVTLTDEPWAPPLGRRVTYVTGS